ncbi:DNA polymerase-3 subunit beta [Amycolatopsis xylanica]|uniref:DNA polymerase-3 subunit beta n=1 Tax=Amycolatopsis xylanica TaxID=589385 RepID=A0A1H2ZC49_9PSEU|nr:DNA polymerase III subunit beta [Amycolatopsis xylanica]SDX14329.1 DNA polymerase-3 subunit beta [Amycolatopsis xylanica]
MDLTATCRTLSEACTAAARLLPVKYGNAVLSGVLLEAGAAGLTLSGNDHERAVRLHCAATTHTDGAALVPAAALAETVRMLDAPQVRLVVEGSRLAVRVPGARFALPLLDRDLHPGAVTPPEKVAEADGSLLAHALRSVAGTASRDETLPVFTGVRLRLDGGRLELVASDRYRMAVASLPVLSGSGPLDALVPATLLSELGKQASGPVGLHADRNRFALSWSGNVASTAVLDGGFLSAEAIPTGQVDTVLELNAGALAAAVRRVGFFADGLRALTLEVGDNQVRLASTHDQTGEAEEFVKADVSGGRTSPSFQAKYLLDALQPFADRDIRLEFQPGKRATVLREVTPGEVALKYLLMPIVSR